MSRSVFDRGRFGVDPGVDFFNREFDRIFGFQPRTVAEAASDNELEQADAADLVQPISQRNEE